MNNFLTHRFKISTRLIIGFCLKLALILVLGAISLHYIQRLDQLMRHIYAHPLNVIDETQKAKINVMTEQREMRTFLIGHEEIDFTEFKKNLIVIDQSLNDYINELKSQYLGPDEDIRQAAQSIEYLRQLKNQTFLLYEHGQINDNTRLSLSEDILKSSQKIEQNLEVILKFARNKATEFLKSSAKEKEYAQIVLLITVFLLVTLGLVVTWIITRSITIPLESLRHSMVELANGNLQTEIPFQHGSTELTAMAQAIQFFKESILNLDQQRWIKSTSNELNKQIQTTESPRDFAQTSLKNLVPSLGGGGGVFYIWNEEHNHLELLSSYGLIKRRHVLNQVKLGESLVGQCALECIPIILTEVPDNYAQIVSGVGEAPPRNIIVIPVVSKQRTLAVIEIGSFSEFNSRHQAFISEVIPMIALNLDIIERNKKTLTLLEETQRQSEELQATEEELRAQSEQLQEKNNQLQANTKHLIEKSELLQASEEELRTQSEELRKANKILAEKGKQLEKASKQAEQRALERDEANRYKSEFLANMSHELRTPLNSLLILARSLRDNEDGNLNAEQIESATIIHDSGMTLLRLINDILDLSKVEAGKMELSLQNLPLSQLITVLKKRFQLLAENKKLTFELIKQSNVPEHIQTDSGKLEQILNNLIGNALKFTEQGSVTVHFKIPDQSPLLKELSLTPEQAVEINVADTGIGIPANKIQTVFNAFEQVDGSTSRQYGGTGLGLSISLRLAQLLKGSIEVESTEGQGSLFRLLLPIQLTDTTKTAEKQNEISTSSSSQTTGLTAPTNPFSIENTYPQDDRNLIQPEDETILIIEDDLTFAKILCDLSRKRGFKCLMANNGINGLDIAARYRPTGIILDIGLPEIDGWQVMEKLKQNPETRQIPVQFISAHNSEQKGLEMGAIGFYTKPISPEQIEKAFEKIRDVSNSDHQRILLINIDPTIKAMIQSLFESKTGVVTEATSTEKAIEHLQQNAPFNCVILDLQQSEVNGLEFLEQCNHLKISLPPVIVYSDHKLSDADTLSLREYTDSIVIKGDRSLERLKDEVNLFLHSIKSNQIVKHQLSSTQKTLKDTSIAGKTILIVDDDMRNTFALSKVLRTRGLNVLMAQDGKKALTQLNSQPNINLVLMDIMMPIMDGFKAIQKIRKQPEFAHLPIIALTAKAMVGDRDKCLAAGANDYLSKPLNIDDLITLLHKHLQK